MASNTLTNIIPIIYAAMDNVSRERIGMVPAVAQDFSAERAAKGQTIRSPVVPQGSLEDIVPGSQKDTGGQTIGYVDMTMDNMKAYPIWWTGEDELGVKTSGQFDRIMQQRIEQGLRTFANALDADLTSVFSGVSRAAGTAGTTPFGSDYSILAELRQILNDNGAPDQDRHVIMNSAAATNLLSLPQLTNVNQAGTNRLQQDGEFIRLTGFDLHESGFVKTQDNSTEDATGTLTVSGVHSKGATTVTLGAATAGCTVVAGNYITIGDHKYMVTTGNTITTGGIGDVVIAEPGLMEAMSGGESVTQNTSNFAANLAFTRNAIQLATRAPARPSVGDKASDVTTVQDPVSGLTFQIALYPEYYGVKYEIGLVWGYKLIKPEHAALLAG